MGRYFDDLETRSADERMSDQVKALGAILSNITHASADWLARARDVSGLDDLPKLPVLRKADLAALQKQQPPLGGIGVQNVTHYFQSPGPIYEPGGSGHDWWRVGRFVHAVGVGGEDIVQNCFSYHLTPAGHIFESAARAVGAAVIPAGTGQTELQVRAAADIGATAYAGTPDYLKTILDKADEMNVTLGFSKAAVGGGPLFPQMRQHYADRGILCLQNYATADVGNIAYESPAMEGMIVDEGVVLEIVRPGTGDRVAPGEVGEVVITVLNRDYPLVRFGTGDLSAILPGESPCGRTNIRIQGWMGRADQTTKVKGMFVRPEQVAELVAGLDGVEKARVTVTRTDDADQLAVQFEGVGIERNVLEAAIQSKLKLRGAAELVAPGTLPNDGKVIDDQRDFG